MKIVIETTEYISKQLHDGTMSDADFEKLYKQARNHIVLSDGYEPQADVNSIIAEQALKTGSNWTECHAPQPQDGDLISRKDVCDYLKEFVNHEYSTEIECDLVATMISGLKYLPSVSQRGNKDE